MTGKQFEAALDKLRMTKLSIAVLFDVDVRTIHRWLRRDGVSGAEAIVLRILLAGKITLPQLRKIAAQ